MNCLSPHLSQGFQNLPFLTVKTVGTTTEEKMEWRPEWELQQSS
jgi:hypothetical protein